MARVALHLVHTSLVLLKSALNARGSKLMPDKAGFGYGFPRDRQALRTQVQFGRGVMPECLRSANSYSKAYAYARMEARHVVENVLGRQVAHKVGI